MSITEVKIYRSSDEEKYYRQKAEQSVADYAEVEIKEKFTWKRTIQEIFYGDLNESHFPLRGVKGEFVGRILIGRIGYDTPKEAFAAAQKQAEEDSGNVPLAIRDGNIVFEVYKGSELPPRNKNYRPNEVIPAGREKFWRYTYEVIKQQI